MATPLYLMNEAMKLVGEDEFSAASFTTNSFANSILAGLNCVMRAIFSVNPRWGELEALSTFATVAAQDNYDLSDAAVITAGSTLDTLNGIRKVLHENTVDSTKGDYELDYIPKEEYDKYLRVNQNDSSHPGYYYYDRKILYLSPKPSAVYNVDVWYQLDWTTDIVKATVESTTIVPYPNGSINMIIWGIIAMSKVRFHDQQAVAQYTKMWDDAILLEELKNDRAPESWDTDNRFLRGMN